MGDEKMSGDESTEFNAMKDKLSELKMRVMTLEWDKSHNQLNSSMEAKYLQIKTEFEALQKKVDGIKAEAKLEEAEAAEAPQAVAVLAEVKEQA